jgi:4-hydroxybenzoate polyprenyltransferase
MIGLTSYILLVANVNLINAYTDVEEDKINLPYRVKLIKKIGYRKLPLIFTSIFIIAILLASLLPFWFLVVFIIAMFDTIFYSLKPLRFKSNPILGLVAFAGAVFFPLVGSWTLHGSIYNIPPIIFFLGYSFLVYGTIKNLPDYEGDKKAGLKTSATIFSTRKKAILFATILLISPYLILLLLILSEYVDYNFILLFTGLPFISLICYKALKTKSFEKLEKLHTYGLIYQVGFLSLAFWIISPTIYSLILLTIILSLLFFILRTKFDSR